MVVNGAPLNAQNGLVVSAGTASINGELVANKGLTVENSTFKANAQVILGNAENGPVTADGTFVAKEGIVLEKPTFQAVNGITISEGDLNVERDLIVSGQLLANNGIRVKDSVLEATGRVILGEVPNGEVTVNGILLPPMDLLYKPELCTRRRVRWSAAPSCKRKTDCW